MEPIFANSLAALQPYLPVIVGGGVACVVLTVLAVKFAPARFRRRDELLDVPEKDTWAPPEGTGADRRTTVRRDGKAVPVLLSSAAMPGVPEPAFVIDRSRGGLKVVCAKPFPVGSPVQVRADNAPDNVPWVTVVVRSCRENGKRHELGCEFEKTPPWNVLLLFG
jgi:hypothetical protein